MLPFLTDAWDAIKIAVFKTRLRLGLVSRNELLGVMQPELDFIEEIPDPAAREELYGLYRGLRELSTITNMPAYLNVTSKISQKMEMISQKYGEVMGEDTKQKVNYIGGLDSAGWRPSGARIFQGFINPFQIFSFYKENHWACGPAVDIIVREVRHDGWSPGHADGLDPAIVAQRVKTLEAAGIPELRIKVLIDRLVYGNSIIVPEKNRMQNLVRFRRLIMDRCFPITDRITERIVGWDEWVGYNATYHPKGSYYHLVNASLKNPDIGIPPLASLVTDIESDLAASALTGTIFHTAGTIGAILVTEDNPQLTAGRDMSKFSRRLQKEIQVAWSGLQGAHGILVTNMIKGVHKLTQIGDLDASFLKWRDEVAKSICCVLGVPPEKISKNRSQGLQYQAALVESSIDKTFDKVIYAYMEEVDAFINLLIKEELKINDVWVKTNGRFGSMTLNGARMSQLAAGSGLFNTNQHLEYFFGMPPLPAHDKRGHVMIDTSINRDPKFLPSQMDTEIPGQYDQAVVDNLLAKTKPPKPAKSPSKKKESKRRKLITGLESEKEAPENNEESQ